MLETIIREPTEPIFGSVIWLHGLGASGDDFVPIVPHLKLANFRFIFPHAPIRRVTLNGGMPMRAWYDIRYLEPGPDRESIEDAEDAIKEIELLIQNEIDKGIPSNRIVLAGFSQGSAMALYLSHRYSKPLLGVIALSGYILDDNHFEKKGHIANVDTPYLLAHGTSDMVVPLSRGQKAKKIISDSHPNTTWKTYPMGHEVCMEEIQMIGEWLKKII